MAVNDREAEFVTADLTDTEWREQPVNTRSVVLEPLRYSVREEMRRARLGAAVTPEMALMETLEGMVVTLAAELKAVRLGGQLIESSKEVRLDVKTPDGPWQRFKESHSGTWWLKLAKPVRYFIAGRKELVTLRVDVKDYAAFPENDMVFPPGMGAPVGKRIVDVEWV